MIQLSQGAIETEVSTSHVDMEIRNIVENITGNFLRRFNQYTLCEKRILH